MFHLSFDLLFFLKFVNRLFFHSVHSIQPESALKLLLPSFWSVIIIVAIRQLSDSILPNGCLVIFFLRCFVYKVECILKTMPTTRKRNRHRVGKTNKKEGNRREVIKCWHAMVIRMNDLSFPTWLKNWCVFDAIVPFITSYWWMIRQLISLKTTHTHIHSTQHTHNITWFYSPPCFVLIEWDAGVNCSKFLITLMAFMFHIEREYGFFFQFYHCSIKLMIWVSRTRTRTKK